MTPLAISKQLLFDGLENELVTTSFTLTIERTTLVVSMNDITGSTAVPPQYPGKQKSREGLELYYLQKAPYLIQFSFGEFQPARYMLYLEAVWKDNR